MKIVVFPLKKNPYQSYLYAPIEKIVGKENIIYFNDIASESRLGFVKDVLLWPYKLFLVKDNQKIFHIHWQFFYFLLNKKPRLIPSLILSLWCLCWVKFLGYKIVWTVHDYNQHETNEKLDRLIRNILIRFTSGFIVLNTITANLLMEKNKVSKNKITYIPIGNYGTDNEYVKKERNSIFTFVFFGLIRKYKGVERLIKVFKSLKYPNIKLEMIGDCYDKTYLEYLKKIVGHDKRINLEDKYLRDDELTELIHNSDITVLPFLEITNSSSALLSYSKGRPVIAPLIGSFNDVPPNLGYLYSYNTEEALFESLNLAIKERDELEEKGENALLFAKKLSWPKISKDTYNFYVKQFENKEMNSFLKKYNEVLYSLKAYLCNEIINNIPSHTFRILSYRHFFHLELAPNTSVALHVNIIEPSKVKLGANCAIGQFTYLDGRGDLFVGNNVNIGSRVSIHTSSHNTRSPDWEFIKKKTIIEDDVWIASNAVLLPGIKIGRAAVIAAGAVVVKNVSAFEIVGGNPAKRISMRNKKINYLTNYFPYFN